MGATSPESRIFNTNIPGSYIQVGRRLRENILEFQVYLSMEERKEGNNGYTL